MVIQPGKQITASCMLGRKPLLYRYLCKWPDDQLIIGETMKENDQHSHLEISDAIINKWQNIMDIVAELVGCPAALIMRLVKSDIEV